jgi:hypothetical protein
MPAATTGIESAITQRARSRAAGETPLSLASAAKAASVLRYGGVMRSDKFPLLDLKLRRQNL